MINHKYRNQFLYPWWSRHYRRRGLAHTQVLATTALCGLKANQEIRNRSVPTWRWSRHPNKIQDTLIKQLDFTEVSSSRHQRMGSKTGYERLNVHPILRSTSVCAYILLHLIIQLFTCYCLVARISLLFLPTLHISSFQCFWPLATNGK